jgi:glucosamine 6-phosphate synthetase-like amidotransferase/phosphosugar isomerase protein
MQVKTTKRSNSRYRNFPILDNSVFTLNSNSASSVDEFKLLRFLKADKEGVVSVEENAKKGVNLDINLLLSVIKVLQ